MYNYTGDLKEVKPLTEEKLGNGKASKQLGLEQCQGNKQQDQKVKKVEMMVSPSPAEDFAVLKGRILARLRNMVPNGRRTSFYLLICCIKDYGFLLIARGMAARKQ